MTITTGTRAAASFPAFKAVGAGIVCAAYGSYDFAAEQAAADTFIACKLPPGAVILGGWLRAEDMDSNASETIDMDVGTSADTDAFGNFGVLTGDAVVDYLPEGGILLPLHGTLGNGPVACSATEETLIQVTFVDDAATFAAGTVTVVVLYVCP